jgi:hypothetical protein
VRAKVEINYFSKDKQYTPNHKNMTNILDPVKVINEIHAHGKETANDSLRVINPVVGVPVAQGDINLWLLPKMPANVIKVAPNHQLAPGTTQGSRHCIRQEDMVNVKFYSLPNPTPLQGNIMLLEQPIIIEHPEHGDQQWPAGIVAVTYQLRHAEEVARVQD